MRKFKDRDFLRTTDGLLFCVVGYLHPPDRVTGYVKYVPVASSMDSLPISVEVVPP